MVLEGRPISWFSSTIELILDGTPIGKVQPKWFSEGFQLDLLGQAVTFEKPSWLKSHFVLKNSTGDELGSATLEGWMRMRWQMNLGAGTGHLERTSWFRPDFVLMQDGEVTATVKTTSFFHRTWQVVAEDTLSAVDVLLVGLVYTLMRRREAQSASH